MGFFPGQSCPVNPKDAKDLHTCTRNGRLLAKAGEFPGDVNFFYFFFNPLPSFSCDSKMQELEQRVIEAEQRAEDAEKQVRDSLVVALVQAQPYLTLNSL